MISFMFSCIPVEYKGCARTHSKSVAASLALCSLLFPDRRILLSLRFCGEISLWQAMACVVECYNPALAPSSGSSTATNLVLLPESLRTKLTAASEPGSAVLVSPRALRELSKDLCSSEHSLHSGSSSTADVGTSPPPREAASATATDGGGGGGIATRAEPSSPRPPPLQNAIEQLGRPSASLAERIHDSMRQREAALPTVQLASPQLHKRAYIVDFLHAACEMLQLTRNTRFLAMLLVDQFMDKHIVMDYRLKLVALACLLVSAKFEEHEEHMVCMEQLQAMAHQCGENPDHYTKQEFLKMELYLLKFFEWSVSHPTAVHFAEYFLSVEDVEMEEDAPANLTAASCQAERVEARAQVDRLTSCFLEASLRETLFLQYPSSLIAAAAFCAARICLGLPTAWNHKLGLLTRYDLHSMSPAVDHMLKLFYNDYDL